MNLVIVESPTKASTIRKFLDRGFQVTASSGHIKDLPEKALGVDILKNFAPQYQAISNKKKIIENIRQKAQEAQLVYIATDPDREGEAIAAHIAEVISDLHPTPHRVLFHEITSSAVRAAIRAPQKVDQNKVDAQIARRVMDRLVGYQVSPLIWKTVAKGLSAGRVQSVALRLVCEREEAIRSFVPQEYWSIHAELRGDDVLPFWTELISIKGDKVDLPDQAAAESILEKARSAAYQVSSIKKSVLKSKPPAPFITSTLQQDAARRLSFSPKRTMALAQSLYEGVELPDGERTGLITYMRTDSTRVADSAIESVRTFIQSAFGKNYLPPKARIYAKKKTAQDAHEAIRPTNVSLTPESLKKILEPPLWKLYDLIWSRFTASQMAEALFNVTVIEVQGDDLIFRAREQKRTFDGYQKVYPTDTEDSVTLPSLPKSFAAGYPLLLNDLQSKQHFTQPPARYTESSLIKALDELGIGRPSTYATIVNTLYERAYTESKARKLYPTPLGETVSKILVSLFPDIFEVGFTARMEEQLDRIEDGAAWVQVVRAFYEPFARALQEAEAKRYDIKQQVQEVTEQLCEKCGKPMVLKWSRRGRFLACSGFPHCRNVQSLEAPEIVDKNCPKCGAKLAIKMGKYGRFLGCPNYPQCRHLEPIGTGVICPEANCGGELVEKMVGRRRYYACNRYPDCKYKISRRPEAIPCPDCGYPFLVHAGSAQDDGQLVCPKCKTTTMAVPEVSETT
ncbi:MAG: type I DNA topoisomerase [bacterium]